MSEQEEVVEIIGKAICCKGAPCYIRTQLNERAETAANYPAPWPCIWSSHTDAARAALTALEARGYTISRSRHGIVHGTKRLKAE
jgi:hypothetical protein